MDLLMAKGGEGAGDMVSALNICHTWARVYNTDVELEYHWVEKQDFKVMPEDPETVGERMHAMNSKMVDPDRVHVEHIFDSDIFLYTNTHGTTERDRRNRAIVNPRRWFFPRDKMPDENIVVPFRHPIEPRVAWKESATTGKTIVMWNSWKNKDPLRKTKKTRNDWGYMEDYIQDRFPEHKIIHLSYRDSFDTAYNAIRDCEFCFGYEGMWHLVAENFGKLLICLTQEDAIYTATPEAKVLNDKQVLPYIDRISDKEALLNEQRIMQRLWKERLSMYK